MNLTSLRALAHLAAHCEEFVGHIANECSSARSSLELALGKTAPAHVEADSDGSLPLLRPRTKETVLEGGAMTHATVEQFQRDGFLLVEAILTGDRADMLRKRILALSERGHA